MSHVSVSTTLSLAVWLKRGKLLKASGLKLLRIFMSRRRAKVEGIHRKELSATEYASE
jgi:hypothetical protein